MATDFRTHTVAELGGVEPGTRVRLAGWVAFKRLHRSRAFFGLRDRSGVVQVVCAPEQVAKVPRESCVVVSGVVQLRPGADGARLAGGPIEVAEGQVEVLNPAAPLPFTIESPEAAGEAQQRWRYLDMRREEVRHRLLVRGELPTVLCRSIRAEGFVGLETPYLAHRSSGGAREFHVVSTADDARRYVLPQSSQVYRTLLMVGGIERYYQVTRNFRDEWMRGNRQFEFSVLDLEAAFVTCADIMSWVEIAVAAAARELVGRQVAVPFPRIPFGEQAERTPSLDFAWMVGAPLFVTRDGSLDTFHQPFDAPAEGWADRLEDAPLDAVSTFFTLVAGDRELGSGSLRIHQPDLLIQVLRMIGQENTNGAVVEALRYGAPPHGGFTLALDALAALLLGERSIRSVVPFPKSSAGRCPVFSAF